MQEVSIEENSGRLGTVQRVTHVHVLKCDVRTGLQQENPHCQTTRRASVLVKAEVIVRICTAECVCSPGGCPSLIKVAC
jgi:hypothetical protein